VLTLRGRAGADRVTFKGTLSRHRTLRPGRYTLIVTATAGDKTSAPARLTFTVLA
jgi:hypothetical protein